MLRDYVFHQRRAPGVDPLRLIATAIVGLLGFGSPGTGAPAPPRGLFQAASTYAVGQYPTSVAAGDLDGDGIPDLAVSNSNSGTLSLLRGHGDGTFEAPITLEAGSYPEVVQIQDINRDGIEDLILGGGGLTVLLGSGGMVYRQAGSYEASVHLNSIAVGDLNGDGIADVAATYPGTFNATLPGKFDLHPHWIPGTVVHVFFGAGDGTFPAETTYTVGAAPYDVTITDLDGNGRNDMIVTNAGSSDLSVLLADPAGKLQPAVQYPSGGGATALAVADLDSDGRLDVALAGAYVNELITLHGAGGGVFGPPRDLTSSNLPEAIAAADVDRDGLVDLILSTDYDYGNHVTIFRGLGEGNFAAPETYETGIGPHRIAVKDLNGDGFPDLAVPNSGSGTLSILMNRGDAPEPTDVPVPHADRLDLVVTPNPVQTSGLITIQLPVPGPARLSAWDIAGRRVWSEEVGGLGPGGHALTLPTRMLPPGAYVIKLSDSRHEIERTIVVMR